MPQTFNVLRCYSCKTFQVQQVKKINKWTCKVCNERQSVIKIFGQGPAAECRKQVQSMNMMRKDEMNKKIAITHDISYSTILESTTTKELISGSQINGGPGRRWDMFMEHVEIESDQDDSDDNDGSFTTSRSEFEQACKKRKKERICQTKVKSNPSTSKPSNFNMQTRSLDKEEAITQSKPQSISLINSLNQPPDTRDVLMNDRLLLPHDKLDKKSSHCSKWTKFLSSEEEND